MNRPADRTLTRSLTAWSRPWARKLAVLTLASAAWVATPSHAVYNVTITEAGGDVVVTGSGSLTLTGMTPQAPATPFAWIGPSAASLVVADAGGGNVDAYVNVTGPANFGAGGFAFASSNTGAPVGFNGIALYVPVGYASGAALGTSSSTYTGRTLAGMGIATGTYTYTLDSGDTIVINATLPPANAAPTATGVTITGTARTGVTLLGGYTYGDAESDPQGTSTFRWVHSTAATGIGTGTETTVATTQSYPVVPADVGSFLYFCVTPVASSGTSPGVEACSAATAAVVAAVSTPIPTLSEWGLILLSGLLALLSPAGLRRRRPSR